MTATAAVSVVVPTLGRVAPLKACLASLAACSPRAAEILVVDQSGDPEVASLIDGFDAAGARLVPCRGRGVSLGRNEGLRAAAYEIVLVTDDDCTVQQDWVEVGARLLAGDPDQIATGRVLPVGDPRAVPSTKETTEPYDYTGEVHGGALFPNNMVLGRTLVLACGGFDERFGPSEAAEDNEFCYRWTRAGHRLRFEPALVVHHHDWRTAEELVTLYARYARGQGFLYAKHLLRGDLLMLRWILRDVGWGVRALASALVKRREAWTDPRRGILRGLPGGLIHGFRVYARGG